MFGSKWTLHFLFFCFQIYLFTVSNADLVIRFSYKARISLRISLFVYASNVSWNCKYTVKQIYSYSHIQLFFGGGSTEVSALFNCSCDNYANFIHLYLSSFLHTFAYFDVFLLHLWTRWHIEMCQTKLLKLILSGSAYKYYMYMNMSIHIYT